MIHDDDQRSESRGSSYPQHGGDDSETNRPSVEALLKDNETLRAMLRRALGPHAKIGAEEATILHLQTSLNKSQDALRQERDRRAVAESLVAELRHDREMSLKAKDAELRKVQDTVTHIKSENNAYYRKSQEDAHVIEVLKRENQRLLDATVQARPTATSNILKAKLASPDYTNLIRSERLRKDVPSCSIQHIGKVPPITMMRALKDKTTPSGARHRDASASSSIRTVRPTRFEVGQRVTCNRVQGVVRYIGDVVGLGKHMAGVELLVRGAGDNEGSFNGVQYFHVPHRSAMFCPLSQLQPPIDTRAVTPLRGGRSPSASTTPRRCHACPAVDSTQIEANSDVSPMRSLNATCTTVAPGECEQPGSPLPRDNSLVRTDEEEVRFAAPSADSGPQYLAKEGSPLYAGADSDHLLSHSMLMRTDNEQVRPMGAAAILVTEDAAVLEAEAEGVNTGENTSPAEEAHHNDALAVASAAIEAAVAAATGHNDAAPVDVRECLQSVASDEDSTNEVSAEATIHSITEAAPEEDACAFKEGLVSARGHDDKEPRREEERTYRVVFINTTPESDAAVAPAAPTQCDAPHAAASISEDTASTSAGMADGSSINNTTMAEETSETNNAATSSEAIGLTAVTPSQSAQSWCEL